MTAKPWIVHHRGGWCALPPGAEPDPDACSDPTLCGHVVTMGGGSRRGWPDCPDCLTVLRKAGEVCDYDTGTAGSGPAKCPRPAQFWWDDPMAAGKRPVCGVHARSVRSKFLPGGGSLSPIGPDPLTVPCLHCGARPGQFCQDFRGGSAPKIHAKRIKSAELAADNPPLREQESNQ